MIDTIKLAAVLPHLLLMRPAFTDTSISVKASGSRERWFWNKDGLRCTYFPASRLLTIEFSIAKLMKVHPLKNATFAAARLAISKTELVLRRQFGVKNLLQMRVMRVDYAWNFEVSEMSSYLQAVKRLKLSHHEASEYPSGVVWKSKQRWVKFYDKNVESGERGKPTLRFEVSTLGRGMKALAQWFGLDAVKLDDVLDRERASYVLLLWLKRLGLVGKVHQQSLVLALRDVFGARRIGNALLVLECIRQFGTAAYREHGLVSQSTYYYYRRELLSHGLLFKCGDSYELHNKQLPSLGLELIHTQEREENLKLRSISSEIGQKRLGVETSPLKFFRKISETAPDVSLLETIIGTERERYLDAEAVRNTA